VCREATISSNWLQHSLQPSTLMPTVTVSAIFIPNKTPQKLQSFL